MFSENDVAYNVLQLSIAQVLFVIYQIYSYFLLEKIHSIFAMHIFYGFVDVLWLYFASV